jgi:hypothetical protein
MVMIDPLLWPLSSSLWGHRLLVHVVDGVERGLVGPHPTWGSLRHSWWVPLVSGAVGITVRGTLRSLRRGSVPGRPLTYDGAKGPGR